MLANLSLWKTLKLSLLVCSFIIGKFEDSKLVWITNQEELKLQYFIAVCFKNDL